MENKVEKIGYDSLDNSVLGRYIHKIVDNPGQRRIYLKIPKTDIVNGKLIKGQTPDFILKNLPKGIRFGEITGRSLNHIFLTLHC